MGFYDGGGHERVFQGTVLAATVVSSFFSVLLIMLLYVMRGRSTGFTTIILAMTILQTMYDVSFYYGVLPGPSVVVLICNLLQIAGGIGSSLFSNILAGIVYYVLVFRRNVDVIKLFPVFCIIVFIPVAVNMLVYIIAYAKDSTHLYNIANLSIYYYIRLLSIFLNFFLYGLTYIAARQILGSTNSSNEVVNTAILTMVSRLKYYPLIQALARSGLTVYEMQYGYDFNPDPVTPERFGLQIYSALITPSASVGYFFVFLYVQPHACNYFFSLLKCSTYVAPTKQSKVVDTDTVSGKSVPSSYYASNGDSVAISVLHSSNGSFKKVTFDSSHQENPHYNSSFEEKHSLEMDRASDFSRISGNSFVIDALSRFSRAILDEFVVDGREDEELLLIIASSGQNK